MKNFKGTHHFENLGLTDFLTKESSKVFIKVTKEHRTQRNFS